jgi:signal transduction histidine kinase
LAQAANAAGRGDRSARVPVEGAREFRAAGAAFNDMQAKIAGFDAERMRTLGAVGHDLRTPITGLRIRAEMLEDEETRHAFVRTLDDMTVMADGLVTYAKGTRDAEEMTIIDLAPFIKQLCETRGASFKGAITAKVKARPVALGRAVGNVIDNALRYAGAATARIDTQGLEARIIIEDNGAGIPTEKLQSMFEPFTRGEDSRNADTGGAGLGLSIARAIIEAHGGSITLKNKVPNGLCVTMVLPMA